MRELFRAKVTMLGFMFGRFTGRKAGYSYSSYEVRRS